MPYRMLLLPLVALAVACSDNDRDPADPGVPQKDSVSFSFEGGLEGWTPRGFDLLVGNNEIAWSITRTQEQSHSPAASARYFADNMTDAAKIFLERPFTVAPSHDYEVRVEYEFGTSDWGNANLWRIIAGALPSSPTAREQLQPLYRAETGNGEGSPSGVKWLKQSYTSNVRSSADGKVYVVVGVWGTWETPRTYYVDDLKVTLTPQ